jgi:hypothetical protein
MRRSAFGMSVSATPVPRVARRNTDLFDRIADDHHEPGDLPVDHRHGRVADSPRGPGPTGVLLPRGDQLLGTNPRWPSRHPKCQISAIFGASPAVA